MVQEIAALVDGLRRSGSFEDAAVVVLCRMLAVCEAALAASDLRGRGKILRGMVHLRPAGGYRGLVVLERGAERAVTDAEIGSPSIDEKLLPSTTAFRWVRTYRTAVAIDVNLGVVEAIGDAALGRAAPLPAGPAGARFTSQESRVRLLSRDTTHIYALPFGARHGAIDGMISLEAACQAAIGGPLVWPDCQDDLRLLADLAAPYLASLPLRSAGDPEPDALLPVVGRATAGLVRLLRVFARQDETLLISGPTGSGKSRLARFCHERSPRRAERFSVVDLLSVPESMQMGELFGWRRGAFTGASHDYKGAVERAERGTLFIDEIDKLSLQAQAGLLGLLEERRYHVLGDPEGARRADVRFLVGTNADLEAAVREGRFREDLYYRINVLPVRLPPLDERADEIPRWAEYMVERRAREGGARARLAAEAGLALAARRWPGNLRQLDNVMRRAYAIALAELGEGAADLVIGERHVEDALAFEGPRGGTGGRGERGREALFDLLRRAAAAFFAEAERSGGRVGLDLADAFRGLVLEAAVRRLGSKDEAFRRLGKENLLKNRNHHKALRREIAKAIELADAVGQEADPELVALSRDDGD